MIELKCERCVLQLAVFHEVWFVLLEWKLETTTTDPGVQRSCSMVHTRVGIYGSVCCPEEETRLCIFIIAQPYNQLPLLFYIYFF